jgi:hypothetical protein
MRIPTFTPGVQDGCNGAIGNYRDKLLGRLIKEPLIGRCCHRSKDTLIREEEIYSRLHKKSGSYELLRMSQMMLTFTNFF